VRRPPRPGAVERRLVALDPADHHLGLTPNLRCRLGADDAVLDQ
jgi:hypothetical protein